MSIFSRAFWKAAAERAIKATAWAAGAALAANGTGLIDTDWIGVVSTAGMAGVLSVIGSITTDALSGGTGPSLASVETLTSTVAAQVTPAGETVAGPASPVVDGAPVAVVPTGG